MKRTSRVIGVLIALSGVVLLPACQNAKDLQIQELQRQVDDLGATNSDLESRLASALSANDRANQSALSLQQQVDDLRRQLASAASAPPREIATNVQMPAGWEGTKGFRWTDVGTDILFDSGKAKLKSNAKQSIAEIARTIQSQWPGRKIFIIGYTDSDPIKRTKHLWQDNLDLSANRAMSVAREFYKLGVDPNLVYAAGQGEHNPVASNDSKANKKLNRRVVIAVVD